MPGCPATALARPQGQERPGVPAPTRDPTLCGRYFINSTTAPTTTARRPRSRRGMYPDEGNRFCPGQRPGAPRRRHLGGRRGDRDDGARELVGHVRHAGRASTRPATCGAPRPTRTAAGLLHRHAVRPTCDCAAENADAQLGKLLDEIAGRSTRQGRQDAGRADRRPRRDVRRSTSTARRPSGAGDSNWYYAPTDLGVRRRWAVQPVRHARTNLLTTRRPTIAALNAATATCSSPTSRPRSRPG